MARKKSPQSETAPTVPSLTDRISEDEEYEAQCQRLPGGHMTPLVVREKHRWREIMREAASSNFTDAQKAVYLEHLSKFGRMGHAAAAASVSPETVRKHQKSDPEFMDAHMEALEAYRETVRQAMFERGVTGWLIPIFGGQYKDQVVGYERQYDSRILAMEAKRVDPEYRDRSPLDVNVNAGVLVVPAGQSIEDWEALQEQQKLANAKVAELVNEHPETSLGSDE